MVELSGTCTVDGNAVAGVVVYAVDADDDTVEATTTTDSSGDYSFDLPDGEYHVAVEYEDGSSQYNSESRPFNALPEITTIEDWEHGDPPGSAGWGGSSVGDFENQTDSTLEGTNNATNTAQNVSMSTSMDVTSQGNEYRTRLWLPAGDSSGLSFAIHGQNDDSGDSTTNNYHTNIIPSLDDFRLSETDGSGTSFTLENASQSFSGQTEYQLGVRHRSDGDVEAALYDASGTQLNSLGPATPSQQHGPGSIWVRHTDPGHIIDDIRQIP